MTSATYSPAVLHDILCSHSPRHNYVIAYSGGMDSHVLLHAMAELVATCSIELRALYVHHGLHPAADHWADHCMRTCDVLNVGIDVLHVNVKTEPGASPEASARTARYQSLFEHVATNEILVTAHHLDDQVETILLHLMRGSGPAGLSGMPVLTQMEHGWLLRPLLGFSRRQLRHYAVNHKLLWIHDTSNYDIRHDRNYIRHRVMPVLQHRWPSATETIAHSARYSVESAALAADLAQYDLDDLLVQEGAAIDISRWSALSTARRKNVLRYWIKSRFGIFPPAAKLENFVNILSVSGRDANPSIRFAHIELHRYRNQLYIMPQLPQRPSASDQYNWDPRSSLALPLGTLRASHSDQADSGGERNANLTVRFRRGGESIRPMHRDHTHALKKLFQEAGVPPWLRDYFPLIYIDDELVLIPGICVSKDVTKVWFGNMDTIIWELPDKLAISRIFHYTTYIN